MKDIYLIRHGHIGLPNNLSRCISNTEYQLDTYGHSQGTFLKDWIKDKTISTIISSPRLRCQETAQYLVQQGSVMIIDERLREVEVGCWEDMTYSEITKKFPQEYQKRGKSLGHVPPPGGESFLEVSKRMYECISEIAASTKGDMVFVSHGGSNRSFLCKILSKDVDQLMEIPQPYGCINHLQLGQGKLKVKAVAVMPEHDIANYEGENALFGC